MTLFNLLQEGILKKHEFSSGDERSRKNSTVESDSDDNIPLKPKSNVLAPPVDKEREAIDIAREKNWEAVKRKHEEASKKEEAEAAIGIYYLLGFSCRICPFFNSKNSIII